MKIIAYELACVSEVDEWLTKGYQPFGAPVFDPRVNLFAQVMVQYEATEVGYSGGVRSEVQSTQATQDLSDVSLDLVENRVYDIDGKELKVGDAVVILEGKYAGAWGKIFSLDPVFSKVFIQGEHKIEAFSSVAVSLRD
jgi:hypothetical protein